MAKPERTEKDYGYVADQIYTQKDMDEALSQQRQEFAQVLEGLKGQGFNIEELVSMSERGGNEYYKALGFDNAVMIINAKIEEAKRKLE